MQKCVITNQETNNKSHGNFPLSHEGREILPKVVKAHNQRIKEAFIEARKDRGLTEEYLEKFAPKVSNKYALSLIAKGEKDIMETLEQVTGVAEVSDEV